MSHPRRRRIFKGYTCVVLHTVFWLIILWMVSESLYPLLYNHSWAWLVAIAFWSLPPLLGWLGSYTTVPDRSGGDRLGKSEPR